MAGRPACLAGGLAWLALAGRAGRPAGRPPPLPSSLDGGVPGLPLANIAFSPLHHRYLCIRRAKWSSGHLRQSAVTKRDAAYLPEVKATEGDQPLVTAQWDQGGRCLI